MNTFYSCQRYRLVNLSVKTGNDHTGMIQQYIIIYLKMALQQVGSIH